MSDNIATVMKNAGVGLNRLLRYGYCGFLLYVFMAYFEPALTKNIINSLTSGLAGLTALFIGTGIYIAHRAVIIPLHHLLLIFFFELKRWIDNNPISPTAILNHNFKVPLFRRMLAYSILRRSDFFENQKDLNIAHAEGGMLVISFTACLIAAIYAFSHDFPQPLVSGGFIWIAGISIVASYVWAWVQHTAEGLVMKKQNNTEKLINILNSAGITCRAVTTDEINS